MIIVFLSTVKFQTCTDGRYIASLKRPLLFASVTPRSGGSTLFTPLEQSTFMPTLEVRSYGTSTQPTDAPRVDPSTQSTAPVHSSLTVVPLFSRFAAATLLFIPLSFPALPVIASTTSPAIEIKSLTFVEYCL